MSKARILHVSQEIIPFLPENNLSQTSRQLPQTTHEKGKEIRVFMPRYGKINERRHQLHEVIRLSGMNLIINDTDHPLIIKVASIPSARMQVYFIDNEEYFKRKAVLRDENGDLFKDNDERSIFFIRGVLETVKKLGWSPDVIHCHGWMSALMPMYVKELYNEDPHFADTKVVYSVYDEGFDGTLDPEMAKKVTMDGIDASKVETINDPTFNNLNALGAMYADGVVQHTADLSPEVEGLVKADGKSFLGYSPEESFVSDIVNFYDEILEGKSELVE
ncbi:MAG: glycogen/starch synthase [Flavobacteriales bacterium]|nr:glycogen/starch synthase [Flavobacteriales bacterium]